MKTNFIPNLQRDAYYDGGYDGDRSHDDYVPLPKKEKSIFKKLVAKIPTWLLAIFLLIGFFLGASVIAFLGIYLTTVFSVSTVIYTLILVFLYMVIYSAVRDIRRRN